MHDVIVIGSGPAGCAAAIMCCQAGLRVLLVSAVPANPLPPVATVSPLESFHPGILSLLRTLHATAALDKSTLAHYTGISINGRFTQLGADEAGPWLGYHVNREAFNHYLLRAARMQGATVISDEKVTGFLQENGRVSGVVTSTGQMFHATFTLDGSGRQRTAGKRLRYREQFYSSPLVAWTGLVAKEDQVIEQQSSPYFLSESDGWSWIAPLPPHYYSWTRLSTRSIKELVPPAALNLLSSIGKIKAFNARWRVFRPLAAPGIILCGDAAGIIDPAYGQGVLTALLSGIVAARCAISCLRHSATENLHLAGYDNWFMEQYEGKCTTLQQLYAEHAISGLTA